MKHGSLVHSLSFLLQTKCRDVTISQGAEPPVPLESMDEASIQRLTTANMDEKSTPQ